MATKSRKSVRKSVRNAAHKPRNSRRRSDAGMSIVERTARLLAIGRREKFSDNHLAEAAKLLRPLSEIPLSELMDNAKPMRGAAQQSGEAAGTVTATPTQITTSVARPVITVTEYANGTTLHVEEKMLRGYLESRDGYQILAILKDIAEQTGAIGVVHDVRTNLSI